MYHDGGTSLNPFFREGDQQNSPADVERGLLTSVMSYQFESRREVNDQSTSRESFLSTSY